MSTSSTEAAARDGAVPDAQLAEQVKSVHRSYPTGVTIVTGFSGVAPVGLAVNAFSSVSLDPPLVLVCLAATSASYPAFFASDRMAVNILAHDQEDVAAAFGRSNPHKFRDVTWSTGEHGAPLLDGVASALEVVIESRLPAFTHTVFIARVVNAVCNGKRPLVYLDRRFFDSTTLPGLDPDE
ncbi:flavin reductase family protein [Streptomyces sp. NPDC048282]|uniref:flavin reductase family protein n=1 Tax=unclassified Streptomyces TaxID=2593676 RepID=UPI003723ADD2